MSRVSPDGPVGVAVPPLVRRLYDLGLLSLPARLRRRRANEMRTLFADLWCDERSRSRARALRFALRATLRAVAAGLAARIERGSDRTNGGLRRPVPIYPGGAGGWLQDIHYGLRGLGRQPGFAVVVVVTLGMAIGVNTTIFSVVRTVVTIPIPYHDLDRLVSIRAANPELDRLRSPISTAELIDLRESLDSVSALAGYRSTTVSLTGVAEATRVRAMQVTTDYFDVTGLPLLLGRAFSEDESDDVVVLGYGAWQRRFGGDPEILGRDVHLDGTTRRVIGVVSPEIEFGSARAVEAWLPLRVELGAPREVRTLTTIGRLADGATVLDASEESDALARRLAIEHPETNRGWVLEAITQREALVGPNIGRVLALLTMAVAFVLLIACVNVANLMRARAGARAREMAVRAALGATRARLARQLFAESVVLALLAGALGLGVARATFAGLVSITRGRVGLFRELGLEPGVIGFGLLLALITPVLFGLLPALRERVDLSRSLTDGGRAMTEGRRGGRLRAALVTGQVSLALVLLVLAVLATRSMIGLLSIELGFDADRTLTLLVDARTGPQAPERSGLRALQRDIVEAVGSLNGVDSLGMTTHLPLVGGEPQRSLAIEGKPEALDDQRRRWVAVVDVDAGYFEAIRLPLLEGRLLAPTDRTDTTPVALVNEAARRRYWPDEPAVGARVRLADTSEGDWLEVVGVVGDTRNSDADQPPEPRVYRALAQYPSPSIALLVRTSGAPEDWRTAVVSATRLISFRTSCIAPLFPMML